MLSDRCLSCSVCDVGVGPYCGQTIGRIQTKLDKQVGLGPDHIVLDGDPAPTKKAQPTKFSAHVYCGQTDGSRCH